MGDKGRAGNQLFPSSVIYNVVSFEEQVKQFEIKESLNSKIITSAIYVMERDDRIRTTNDVQNELSLEHGLAVSISKIY